MITMCALTLTKVIRISGALTRDLGHSWDCLTPNHGAEFIPASKVRVVESIFLEDKYSFFAYNQYYGDVATQGIGSSSAI